MTWLTRTASSALVVLASILGACTDSNGSTPPQQVDELSFTLVSGEGCATGCDLDRPLMVGGTEHYLLTGPFAVEDLVVQSSDPGLVDVFFEDVTLCTDWVSTWIATGREDCDGLLVSERMLTVGANHPGAADVIVRDPASNMGEVGRLHVEAILPQWVGVRLVETDPDTPFMPLASVALFPGASVDLRIDVWGGTPTRRLQASGGLGAYTPDPEVVVLGTSSSESIFQLGQRITLTGEQPGRVTVLFFAGEMVERVEVVVLPTWRAWPQVDFRPRR